MVFLRKGNKMKIDYRNASIASLKCVTDPMSNRNRISAIDCDGEMLKPTDRFWTSVCSRFGFNPSIFTYFNHAEVFERIAEKQKGGQLGLTIERNDNGDNKLLGVSNPSRPVARHQNLIETLSRFKAEDISYSNGIISSQHTPRVDNGFITSGDKFNTKFYLNTPIDGYGSPSIYLGLLRLVCSNGMVALSKAFKSDISLGKGEDDVMPAIIRALDSFNNDEGYAALQQRVETSTKSWASMYEANSLQQLLYKININNQLKPEMAEAAPPEGTRLSRLFATSNELEEYRKIGNPMFRAFHSMTGDATMIYGLANLDTLSGKRQRALPVKCTTYDLINFATEVATHYANGDGARRLNGWVGDMISNEFDMENTMESHKDFADFHISSHLKLVNESLAN